MSKEFGFEHGLSNVAPFNGDPCPGQESQLDSRQVPDLGRTEVKTMEPKHSYTCANCQLKGESSVVPEQWVLDRHSAGWLCSVCAQELD